MCSSIIKVVSIFLLLNVNTFVFAIDTSKEEKTCNEIGFKRKTEAFANCVLELVQRNNSSQSVRSTQPSQISSGNPDDITCNNYGFKTGTNDFAQCKLQINTARQQAQLQQQQYEQQKRQYDEQQAKIASDKEKQDRRKAAEVFLRYGSGQSVTNAIADTAAGKPFPQTRPQPPQQTSIMLPGGKMVHCETVGNVTNCF
jgi:hypothetical protein